MGWLPGLSDRKAQGTQEKEGDAGVPPGGEDGVPERRMVAS